ncbi:MAG: hypothetical protein WCP39_08205, partial [Chlamydiota bacterium]
MKHLFLTTLFFLFFVFFPPFLFAQTQPTATPVPASTTTEYVPKVVCLKSDRCDKVSCTRTQSLPHTAKITFEKEESKRPPVNTDFVIMECLKTDNPEKGEICTVGDSSEQYWSYLTGDPYKYAFQGLFSNTGTVLIPAGDTNSVFKTNVPRFQRNAQDKFLFGGASYDWLEWQSYTAKGVDRRFKALFKIPMTKQAVLDALKQKTIDEYAVGQDCVWINWDPDGRVFDSISLEPIPDVSVQILEKKPDGSFAPVVNFLDPLARNPSLTDSSGKFSFFVEGDNDYRLVINPPEGYEFSLTEPIKPHVNATKIYRNIYPINTGVNIYEAKGKKETRDIPLRPKLGVGKEYPLTSGYTVERLGKSYMINLSYSHPFTKIVPFSVNRTTGKETMLTALSSNANASGSGKVSLRFSQLPQGDDLGGVYAEKIILTGDLPIAQSTSWSVRSLKAFFSKIINNLHVSAQSTKSLRMIIDPIPSYLEGVAYDSGGKLIPNAKVTIYMTNLSVPYYETTA